MPEMGEMEKYSYNRANVTAGIAHIGVGNFHRSHQAMYVDRMLNAGTSNDWGITGIGMMPGDIRMRDALASQNYGYTLVEKNGDGSATARQIGSLLDMLLATEDPNAVLTCLSDPSARIVSLTITEGGYNIDQSTGEFDLSNPMVERDIRDPKHPVSVFGFLVEALRLRKLADIPPFTVMSCDNLPGNGDVAKQALLTYARTVNADLASWIESYVSFPNSMVDRITPVTTDSDRAFVKSTFGVDDSWPVITEPFTQWVLEDKFCNGRPAFESVGVQMVDDVLPYELMKLRLLNASHQAMAYVGVLGGYTFVHEAVADQRIEHFLRSWLEEARETLPPVPEIDLDDYIDSLFERFRNPYIADTLARLAVDASDRIPKFVLPAVRENRDCDRPTPVGAAIIASWMNYILRSDDLVDSRAAELKSSAHDPTAFLANRTIFGELGSDPEFVRQVAKNFEFLWQGSVDFWPGSFAQH